MIRAAIRRVDDYDDLMVPVRVDGIVHEYYVTASVRVYHTAPGRYIELTPYRDRRGKLSVSLKATDGSYKTYRLSTLVARVFLGAKGRRVTVQHIDGNIDNCTPENLEIVPQFVPPPRYLPGEQHINAKLTAGDVRLIRKALADEAATVSDLARMYDVTDMCIVAIQKRKSWRHVR